MMLYHCRARSQLSSASYALPRKKHIAALIWQANITINHHTKREREREAWGRERRVNTHWSHGLQHPYQSKCHCHHPDQQRFHAHLFLHLQVWSNTDAILSTPPNQPKQNDETVAKIKGKTVDKIKDYTGLYTRAQIRKIYTES